MYNRGSFCMARKYITTAIDYPNAAPHMGHQSRKENLAFFLPWTILSLYGVASDRSKFGLRDNFFVSQS
jgi:hypothetical protein